MDPTELGPRLEQYITRHGYPHTQVENLRPLAGGWETDVYAFTLRQSSAPPTDLVLRAYASPVALGRSQNECHVLRLLPTMGYPVPKVWLFESNGAPHGLPGPFLVMEQIQGETLGRAYGRVAPERRAELHTQFCQLFVQLHTLDWRPFVDPSGPWRGPEAAPRTMDPQWLLEAMEARTASDALAPALDWLQRRGAQVEPEPLCLLHGDFHPENIILRDDGSPTVIDWGVVALGDPRSDLAYTCILSSSDGRPAEAAAIRSGYEAARRRPVGDFDYFEAQALTRRVGIMLAVVTEEESAMGMRQGIRQHLRKLGWYVVAMADQITGLTGVALPGVRLIVDSA